MKIDVVDVGSGNIRSVLNWLESCNLSANCVSSPESITADTIILPGVGAAENMMEKLEARDFIKSLKSLRDSNIRLIGICLGFQILFESTEENSGIQTLGILPGKVEKIQRTVPSHNAWEEFALDLTSVSDLANWQQHFKSRKKYLVGRCYYNHEYAVVNRTINGISLPISNTLCEYSGFVINKNVLGMQFHPEKSQKFGKELLRCLL